MVFNMTLRRTWGVWLTSLILAGLVLAACGGAADPVSEEPTAPAETKETAGTVADSSEEQAQESQQEVASATEEEAAEEESEEDSTTDENLLAPEPTPSGPAECIPATATNDPLVAAIQPYDQIASPSDSDWSKGPADAPITVIEYGDFQ